MILNSGCVGPQKQPNSSPSRALFAEIPPPVRLHNASEQQVYQHQLVQSIAERERPRWKAEVCTRPHLHSTSRVGHHVCSVAKCQGPSPGVGGLSSPRIGV